MAAAASTGGAVITGEALTRNERRVAGALTGGLDAVSIAGARCPRLLAWPIAVAAGVLGAASLRTVLRSALPAARRT